jgi:gas vesicle protein
MKKVLVMVAAGMMIGAIGGSYARLPAAPAKTEAEKAAEAEKVNAAKAQEAAELAKAQDKAVANYRKHKGVSMDAGKK